MGTSKKRYLRVGVIGPGGAGRGNTLGFATRPDAEVVAACGYPRSEFGRLRKRVSGTGLTVIKRTVSSVTSVSMNSWRCSITKILDIVGVFSPHSLHDIHVKYALRGRMPRHRRKADGKCRR